MRADISECPSILPEREKRNLFMPEKDSLNTLPRCSLSDEILPACRRTNGDSTLKSTIRDAFPLRELQASQQTGDNAAIRSEILAGYKISIHHKYCRPRSHRVKLAASGDPRTNDSTLKSTIRDAFPLRELRASQQTGDIAPLSTPSASDISRHDRSCLHFDFKEQNEVLVKYE
ncbi:LOW QUALITY PROTEIN: hypothetical protein V1477_016846 [Vespula maculifrons]|uniref:Uncharacterized protein n=1 Tax=Vespula maculifrons TaxID=7453 RepID=A0ABD2B4D5_VESMC